MHRHRTPTWIFRGWWALLGLSAVLIAVVGFSQQRQRAAMRAFTVGELRSHAEFRTAADRFRDEEKSNPLLLIIPDPANRGILRPRTRAELELSLFPGRAVPTTLPVDGPNVVGWHDTVRKLRIYFKFRPDGTWSGSVLSPDQRKPPDDPWLLRLLSDTDRWRRMWVGSFTPFTIGPMLWAALLWASLFRKRAALPLSHAHLAVAWLCFLGWLLNPGYSISWRGIFSNDMLFWGALMLAVSGGAMWVVSKRRPDPADRTRCGACGYDLTGNVSGVCPECGTAVVEDRAAAATSH